MYSWLYAGIIISIIIIGDGKHKVYIYNASIIGKFLSIANRYIRRFLQKTQSQDGWFVWNFRSQNLIAS